MVELGELLTVGMIDENQLTTNAEKRETVL